MSTPEAEAYFLKLVDSGEECPHPEEFRVPFDWDFGVDPELRMPAHLRRPADPNEWTCTVCETSQVQFSGERRGMYREREARIWAPTYPGPYAPERER